MTKGFALNDERFINGNKYDTKYFNELLERIKTIRVSEKMAYQKITDLFIATSTDYNPKSEETYTFFKIVQNKLRYVICFQNKLKIKSPLNKAFNIFAIRKNRVQILIIY